MRFDITHKRKDYPMDFVRAIRLGLLSVCLAFLAFPSIGQTNPIYSRIVLGGFSPDGKQLALSYCLSETDCKTGIYDLARKRFSVITPTDKDNFYIPGGISPDGKRLAVTVRRESDKGAVTQLGLLDLATGKLTELTHAPGRRSGPSFSHDGKKIIYAMAGRERDSGMTRFVDWDIYEIGVAERRELRLTSFNFFAITPPAYIRDDEHFIFSGTVTNAYVSPSGKQGRAVFNSLYKDNTIFSLAINGPRTLEPLFQSGDYSNSPVVSADGAVLVFKGQSNKEDGIKTRFTYDLFLFDGKGQRRLTKLGDPYVVDIAMTSSGGTVAFVLNPRDQRHVHELKLLDMPTGQVASLNPEAGLMKVAD